MPRDAEATKQRIFDAATAEFTAHGIAGARVDRIAHAARANKQLIYAYFGSKRELFETVVSHHVDQFAAEAPYDPADIPGWAGSVFDFFVEHPQAPRLFIWHSLEPEEAEHRIPAIARVIERTTRETRRAQKDGRLDAGIGPDELGAILNAITRTWVTYVPERAGGQKPTPRTVARRRAAIVESVRRLVAPASV